MPPEQLSARPPPSPPERHQPSCGVELAVAARAGGCAPRAVLQGTPFPSKGLGAWSDWAGWSHWDTGRPGGHRGHEQGQGHGLLGGVPALG